MIVIRKPTVNDTPAMYELINMYADEGRLLHRSITSIYEYLQCFYIAEHDNEIIGTASLHILDKDLAEIRSLTVAPGYVGKGIGKLLVNQIKEETRTLGIKTLLSLTYQVQFFLRCEFELIEKEKLPMQKVWKDCMSCPKFSNCDENAMVIHFEQPTD